VDLVHLTLNDLHYYHYGPSGPPHYLSSYLTEPTIRGSLRTDHCGEVHSTHNLAEKEKAGKRCGRWVVMTKITRGKKLEGLWKIHRVIDKQRRRRVTFILNFR
jgi:hypothetical protein